MDNQNKKTAREQQRIKNEEKRALKNLPIYSKRQEILDRIKQNKFTIIVGETGSGKSTQLPQYLFEEYEQNRAAKILWVLPRKLFTASLAGKVCQETEMALGEEIGYELVSYYRFKPETRLKFVFDSILVRELIKIRENLDPIDKIKLDYSVIVLDEVHERNSNTDILLSILKEVALNSDLKLVITSATINERIFGEYFNTKPIQIAGRQYPIKIEYNPCPKDVYGVQHVTDSILDMLMKMTRVDYEYRGHILVFTSGIDDINLIWEMLESYTSLPKYHCLEFKKIFEVLPLHTPEEPQKVFEDLDKIKIILATSMAETAITIEGVRVVIDIGHDKETIYDPTMRMNIIETHYITQSSAIQRAGRTGRTAPGLCIRLYSEEEFEIFPKHKIPQIQKMDLGKVILELKAMRIPDVMSFDFIEKPSQENLMQTIEHLKNLDAFDNANGNLTDIGKAMLNLDTDPTFSKVIIEGLSRNCEDEVIKIIAMIRVAGNLYYRDWDDAIKEQADKKKLAFCHKSGDLITLLNIFEITETLYDNEQPRWFRENYLDFNAFKDAKKTKIELQKGLSTVKQILKIKPEKLDPKLKKSEEFYELIIKCFFRAFYRNVCHYDGNPRLGYCLLRTNIIFKIDGSSSLAQLQENPEYIICLDMNGDRYNPTKIASSINKKWIQKLLPYYKRSKNLSLLKNLLIHSKRQEIINHIKHNKFTIITGDTGCGKSTQIPQYLFEEYKQNENAKILWVLPSNVPIVPLAERVCQEMEMTSGEEIGFELVSESKFSSETRLKFVHDSILVRELIKMRENLNPADKIKLDYSVIVLDEVHERNLNTDILLSKLKEVALHSDLKLVITSATNNEQIFEKYFNTKPIHIEGTQFAVKIQYNPCHENEVKHVTDTILGMVRKMTRENYEYKGHILVITSGVDDINLIWEFLENYALLPEYQSLKLKQNFEILPLHGLLYAEEQKKVFEDLGKIKIILATRMAETAITIEGVRVVIDIGYDKETIYDPTMRMNIIETRYITQSSAVQRAGRAGRTAPGLCIRLYSEEEFKTFSKNKISQIQRMDLGKVVLELKAMGVQNVTSFEFIEKPSQENLVQTIEHLKDLDALNLENENLTEIGKAMLKLDTDPTFSKVIIEGLYGNCEEEVIKIIAMIGIAGNIYYRDWDDAIKEQADKKKLTFCHKSGDLITLLKIFEKTQTLFDNEQPRWFKANYLNFNAFKGAKKNKFDLEKGLSSVKKILKIRSKNLNWRVKESEKFYESIIKCFLRAFYQNVCHYSGKPGLGYCLLRSDIILKIYGSSSLALLQENPEYMICLDVNRNKYHHTKIASAINNNWIEELFPNHNSSQKLSYLSKTYNLEEFVESRITRSILDFFSDKKMAPEIKEVAESFHATFYPAFFQERLYVYTPKSNKEELRKKIKSLLDDIRSKFKSEIREIPLVQNTRGIFKSGGEIKEILLDKETRSIAFKGFNPSWDQKSLFETFNTIANDDVDSMYVKVDQISKLLRGTIKMKSSKGVENVLKYYEKKGLNEFSDVKSKFQPVIKLYYFPSEFGAGKAFTIKIQWYTGVSEKEAQLGFKNNMASDWAYSELKKITQNNDFKRLFTAEQEALRKTLDKPLNFRKARNINHIIFENLNSDVDEDDIKEILRKYNIEKDLSFVSIFRVSDRTENLTPKTCKDVIRAELKTQLAIDSSQIIRLNSCLIKPPFHDKITGQIIKDYRRSVELDVEESEVAKKIIGYFDYKSLKTLTNGRLRCWLVKTFKQENQEKGSVCAKKDEIQGTEDSKKQEERSASTVIEKKKPLGPSESENKDKIQGTEDSKQVNECINKIEQEKGAVCDKKDEIQRTEDSKKQEERSASTVIENKKPLDPPGSDKQNSETQKTGNDQEGNLKTPVQIEKPDLKAIDNQRIEQTHNVEKDLGQAKREIEPSSTVDNGQVAPDDSTEILELFKTEISFKFENTKDLLTKDGRLQIPLEKMYDIKYEISQVTKQIKISGSEEDNVEEAANEVRNLLGFELSESEINERKCSECTREINGGCRLQLCGHKFCYRCITNSFDEMPQNGLGFPLHCPTCLKEKKKTEICIEDLGKIVRTDKFRSLWYKSLESYVIKNSELYFRCFSPYCKQVFKKSSEKNFSCDNCLRDFCKICGRKPHGEQKCSY